MMHIEVISRDTIKPSCPTPYHLRYFLSSLIDHTNVPLLMPLIFFYSNDNNFQCRSGVAGKNSDVNSLVSSNDSAHGKTLDDVMHRLKGSLPHVLSVFYPLAGRVKDANHIICNDEGIPYVEVMAKDTRLEDVVHKAEVIELHRLVNAHGHEGYSKLLLAIQVTSFACGGLAIGMMMSHAIGDAFSILMFVKTWADIANGANNLTLRPFLEMSKVFPPPQPLPLPNTPEEPGTGQDERLVTKRFRFDEAKLTALRSTLYANHVSLPSLAMVLSAFIWSRIKVACYSNNSPPCEVFHAVNIRPKVNPPTNSYYFGNMVINAIAKTSNEENAYHNFLETTKESIGRILKEDVFVREMQAGKADLGYIQEFFERADRGEISPLGFSNLRSLPVYESDFGWGKPVWVTTAKLLCPGLTVLIPAGPSSKDMDAYINLEEEDMKKLLRDREFPRFVSYINSKVRKL